jgi:hypothetical protein
MLEASLFALGERGIVPRLDDGGAIKIDGGNIDVEFSSPLAQAQNLRDIETVLTWLQQLQLLGEEAMMLSAKVEDIGAWLGDKQNVPPELMREQQERQNLQGMAGQLLARQQQGAVLPEGAPGPWCISCGLTWPFNGCLRGLGTACRLTSPNHRGLT